MSTATVPMDEARVLFQINLGARIFALRERLGMSQEDFGIALGGAHRNRVSSWENGESMPSAYTVFLLHGLARKNGVKF